MDTVFWIVVGIVSILMAAVYLYRFMMLPAPNQRPVGQQPTQVGPRAPATVPAVTISGDGSFGLAVVGESHYRSSFEALLGPRTAEGVDLTVTVQLVREPANPYDANAVAVYLQGRKLGYLSRNDALRYRAMIENASTGGDMYCRALIRGGWDNGDGWVGDYGVCLDLPPPPITPVEKEDAERTLFKGRRSACTS